MQERREEKITPPIFDGFLPPRERIVLEDGGYRLEVWPELGGSIARFDRLTPTGISPLFRPTATLDRYMPTDLACWPLVPYSNRIAHGRFEFDGKHHTLPLNVANHPHALHGIGWQRPWRMLAVSAESCRLGLDHAADADWPFSFSAEQTFTVDATGLTLTTSMTNKDNGSMPYGFGQHPYIVRPHGTKLTAQVKGVWLTDDTVMPIDYTDLPSRWNLRKGCTLDGVFMDNCFDGLKGSARILWPDGVGSLIISGSANLDFLVVYNPPQEDYVCVEPVSHMTDAINRAARGLKDTGFRVLAPGASASATHRFAYASVD